MENREQHGGEGVAALNRAAQLIALSGAILAAHTSPRVEFVAPRATVLEREGWFKNEVSREGGSYEVSLRREARDKALAVEREGARARGQAARRRRAKAARIARRKQRV